MRSTDYSTRRPSSGGFTECTILIWISMLRPGPDFTLFEILLSMIIKVAAILLIGAPAWSVLAFEVLLNATSMFNHSNIFLNPGIDRVLRLFVVTLICTGSTTRSLSMRQTAITVSTSHGGTGFFVLTRTNPQEVTML